MIYLMESSLLEWFQIRITRRSNIIL